MKTKLFLTLVSICAFCFGANAQASAYTFSAVAGTYSPITGGTLIVTPVGDSYTTPTLTFSPGFMFAGVTYTNAYMTSNGLLNLGGTAPGTTIYNGILNTTGSGISIAPMNCNLISSTMAGVTPGLRFETVGNEHVFQWMDMSRSGAGATERFSFQVRLNTSTKNVTFIYDAVATETITTFQPVVGLRTSPTDFKNLSVTPAGLETWAAPLIGTLNTNDLRFSASAPAKFFTSGQTYIWSPGCQAPSPITYSPLSYSAATANWNAGNNETIWIFGFGTPLTGPPTTTVVTSNTSYPLPGLSPSTTYSVRVRAYCGVGDTSVWVNSAFTSPCQPPILSSVIAASVCVSGSITLQATTASSANINWYTAPTGGVPTSTVSLFTTPLLNSTTTYYAAAFGGVGLYNVGYGPFTSGSSGIGATTYGLYFDALVPLTIQSVIAYPQSTNPNTPGTITVNMINPAGTILQTGTFNVVGNPQNTTPTPQTLNLNFSVLPGTNYRLVLGGFTGISGVMFQPSGTYPYPYSVPGVVQITSGTYSGVLHPELYYYFYNWTVVAGCESARVPVVATVRPKPTILAISSATGAVCAGSPVNLLCGGNATSFTWTPSGGSFSVATVSPNTTTTYTVAAELAAHCATTATVSVVVNPKPIISINSVNTTLCSGETAMLSVSGNAVNYVWYPDGGINPTAAVNPSVTTTYVVTGYNGQGCAATSSIQIDINDSPSLQVTASKTLACQRETVTLYANTNANSFVWSNSSTSLSTNVTPLSTTTYSISASNGLCTSVASITITTDACTAIEKQDAGAGISLYPNPINDALTVTMTAGSDRSLIQIYDVVGKLVVSQTLSHEVNTVNVSSLNAGVYMFKVLDNNNEVKTGKIVKN